MTCIRRLLCLILCLLMVFALAQPAGAAELEDIYIRNMISYYFHYREQAAAEIDNQLEQLSSVSAGEGAVWRKIMDSWAWINEEMTIDTGVLPDGLPGDDSLCIVVLGYGLNDDGSMKRELVDRLEVALASAEKYPEAYVLCTGGETSDVRGVSEAGQMIRWLKEQGLREGRLIAETASLSTTANAQNCCRLLWRDYPQISSIAIVSSDYHIRWGSALFVAMAQYCAGYEGKPELELVGNAACTTASPEQDTMYAQAWGISIIAGVSFDSTLVPTLYLPEETAPAETEPEETHTPLAVSQPVTAEETEKEPVAGVLLLLAAALVIVFIPKKKRKSGSD